MAEEIEGYGKRDYAAIFWIPRKLWDECQERAKKEGISMSRILVNYCLTLVKPMETDRTSAGDKGYEGKKGNSGKISHQKEEHEMIRNFFLLIFRHAIFDDKKLIQI